MTLPSLLLTLAAIFPHDGTTEEVQRYTVTAVAMTAAIDEQVTRGWHGSRAELEAATLTIVAAESGMARSVHDGSKRGGKAVCLGQIEPSNGLWREYAKSHEDLAGVDYAATLACMRTIVRTLASARALCRRKGYEKFWAAAMFTHYATGNQCVPSSLGWKRARMMRRMM